MPNSNQANETLLKSAHEAANIAKKSGADDAWVSVSRDRSVSYDYRDGKLDKVQESTSRGLSLAVYADGRYAVHHTTDLVPARLASFIKEAVALTKALEPDPARKIPDPELFKNRPNVDLQLRDAGVANITREQREEYCKAMDAAAHADKRVISAESGTFSGETEGAAVSTNGFEGSWDSSYMGYATSVTVREDGDKRPEGSYHAVSRFTSELPKPDAIAKEALKRAIERIGSKKGATVRTHMVVDREAAISLISRALGPGNAASIQQGRSYFKDKLGKKLFGDKLTITDDPLIPRGMGSRHFDGEGISAKPLSIIDGGVVKNIYVDTYYGRKLGMAPTTGSASNRVVKLGSQSLAELLKEAGKGIYVTSWLGGNSDATTGDFSLGLRGFLIENGKIGAPIGEMNITGNLPALFEDLVAVGNDPYLYASLRAPSLMFKDVQFSGV